MPGLFIPSGSIQGQALVWYNNQPQWGAENLVFDISGVADGNILAYNAAEGKWTNRATLPATAGVDSVTNTDGTLTIAPTTGAVVASLALGHANTWTALQTFNLGITALGAAINLNVSSNFATNINTGTSTGAVSIGNSAAGALTLTSGAASTWDIGNHLLSLQTTGNGPITTGTGLVTIGLNMVVQGAENIGSSGSPIGSLSVPLAPPASANYGLVNLGNGGFAGGVGNFSGAAQGTYSTTTTYIALNAAAGYAGQFMNFAVGGTTNFAVDFNGDLYLPFNSTIQLAGSTLSVNASGGGVTAYRLLYIGGSSTVGSRVIIGGSGLAGLLTVTSPNMPPAGATIGSINWGIGFATEANAFNGTGAGHFVGSANGTAFAININSGFTGNILDAQIAGVSFWSVSSAGAHTFSQGLTSSGGIINLNVSSNFAVNIGTGTSTGAITLGNSANTLALNAPTTLGAAITATGQTITGGTFSGPTLSGTVSGTPTWASNQAITLSTAAQPNITSLGTLTSLTTGSFTANSGASISGKLTLSPPSLDRAILINASTQSGLTGYPGVELWVSNGPTWNVAANATVTNQNVFNINAPTWNGVAGSPGTVTTTATLYIGGAPIQGTNVTLTNTYALQVNSGLVSFGGAFTSSGGVINLNASSNFAVNIGTGTTTSAVTIGNSLNTLALNAPTTVSQLLTTQLGITATGAAINLNASSNFATNINTGTSTGAVSIGNSAAGALTIASGAASTLTVTGANLTISTATSGILALISAGALNLTGAAASTWDIGANTLSIQTTNHGGISLGGNLSFSATTYNITMAAIGNLTSALLQNRVTAQQSLASSVVLTNVTNMVFTPGTSQDWAFEFLILWDSPNTENIQFAITAPTGATIYYETIDFNSSNAMALFKANASGGAITLGGQGAGTIYPTVIKGIIRMSTTAGNCQLQFAQGTSGVTNTNIDIGSYVIAMRLV